MMMPALASWKITSQAPTASTPDCSIIRRTLDADPNPPATSLAVCLLARYLRLASSQAAATRVVMPIAVRASALRRLVSASELRVVAKRVASLVGSRVSISVK